jgi:hypothetical protein
MGPESIPPLGPVIGLTLPNDCDLLHEVNHTLGSHSLVWLSGVPLFCHTHMRGLLGWSTLVGQVSMTVVTDGAVNGSLKTFITELGTNVLTSVTVVTGT